LRVLWFTNTPSLGANYLNDKPVGSGWIGALEAELSKISDVQLGISFNVNRKVEPFRLIKTNYYPLYITSPKNKLKKLVYRWTKPIQDEKNIQPYLDIIDEFKPDIINIFGTEEVFGLIISKTDIPCVIHIQGNLIICDRKWYTGLTAFDILKYSKKWSLLKGFGNYHNYFINKKMAERERRIFEQCKYFMGRTDWDRRITSVLAPGARYFHCDEIIRPQFYSQQWEIKKANTGFTLMTTIRANVYKGLETIFECKRILDKLNSDEEIIWKIAGISETTEISYLLERKFRTSFRENGIELLGPLEAKKLLEEMLESDVFIHPSHIDNSPNSVCEAMLLGMPLIATFAGGIPSIVQNKKEGLLVQDGDPYALAGAIMELKKDTAYANSLGANARERARIRHNPEKIINELLNIYSSMT